MSGFREKILTFATRALENLSILRSVRFSPVTWPDSSDREGALWNSAKLWPNWAYIIINFRLSFKTLPFFIIQTLPGKSSFLIHLITVFNFESFFNEGKFETKILSKILMFRLDLPDEFCPFSYFRPNHAVRS